MIRLAFAFHAVNGGYANSEGAPFRMTKTPHIPMKVSSVN